jgi:hypothetical protein
MRTCFVVRAWGSDARDQELVTCEPNRPEPTQLLVAQRPPRIAGRANHHVTSTRITAPETERCRRSTLQADLYDEDDGDAGWSPLRDADAPAVVVPPADLITSTDGSAQSCRSGRLTRTAKCTSSRCHPMIPQPIRLFAPSG